MLSEILYIDEVKIWKPSTLNPYKLYIKSSLNKPYCSLYFISNLNFSFQCSVTCGKGVNMRAVKCRTGNFSQEDDVCDASRKVNDRQPCFLGPCPTEAPTSTTTIKSVSKGGFWRAGAWTEVDHLF